MHEIKLIKSRPTSTQIPLDQLYENINRFASIYFCYKLSCFNNKIIIKYFMSDDTYAATILMWKI